MAAPDAKLKAAAEQAQTALIETLRTMCADRIRQLRSRGTGQDGRTEARLKALGFKTERRKVSKGPGPAA